MKYTAIWLTLVITLVGIAELVFGVDFCFEQGTRLATTLENSDSTLRPCRHPPLLTQRFIITPLRTRSRRKNRSAKNTLPLLIHRNLRQRYLTVPAITRSFRAIYGIFGALAMLRPFMVVWVEYIPYR